MNFETTKGLMTLESEARKASKLLTKPWLKSKVQEGKVRRALR
jgi:hypothetical protein